MHSDRNTSSSRRTLCISWAALSLGIILVAAYHWAAGIASRTYELPLTLEPHSSAEVRIFSLFGQAIQAEVLFQLERNEHRQSDLGDWFAMPPAGNALIFPNPGKRVAFAVSVNGGGVVNLEAMPASGYGAGFAVRKLSEDQPTDRHRWARFSSHYKLRVAPGTSNIVFTVTDVDPALVAEKVTILIQPPFGFMGAQQGYFVFSLLGLLYLIGLLGIPIWAILLIRRSWREYRIST